MIRKLTPKNHDPYDRPNEKLRTVPVVVGQENDIPSFAEVKTSNLRFQRKKFTFAVTAFVIGTVLLLMQSPVRNEFLAPGPLTSNHAQILAGQGGDRCAACHDAGNQSFSEWMMAAFRPGKKVQACQSQLCMKCHANSIDQHLATQPHNLDSKKLNQIASSFHNASTATDSHPPTKLHDEIQCSACHREHHGHADLTRLSDQQCQSCHSQTFDRFESGHPEFVNWSQEKRQRIAFDHVSHHFKHFPNSNTEFACNSCHVDDKFQSVKLHASYEQTCAKCHQKDIDGTIEQGMAIVKLPMLDLHAIEEKQLSIGDWPDNASGDFDGEIPELMRLLLYKDNLARNVMQKRSLDFEFSDLDPDVAEDVQDAVDLAWATKFLFYDLATKGVDEIKSRLEFAFQRSLSDDEFLVLTNGLDASVFAAAANQWLPVLATEVPAHRSSESGMATAEMIRSNHILRYVKDDVSGLLVENPLKAKMKSPVLQELDIREKVVSVEKEFDHQLTDDSEPRQGDPSLDQPMLPQTANEASNLDGKQIRIPGSELLAKNPLVGLRASQQGSRPTDQANGNSQSSVAAKPPKTNLDQQNKIAMQQQIDPSPNSSTIQNNFSVVDINQAELLAENPIAKFRQQRLTKNSNQQSNAGKSPSELPKPFVDSKSSQPLANMNNNESEMIQEFAEKVADAAQSQQGDNENGFPIQSDANPDERYVGVSTNSGWFRNDQLFQVSYRPIGHADHYLSTIMDAVSKTTCAAENPATAPFFAKMTSESSVGACNRCHTIDSGSEQDFQVNWKPSYRDPGVRSFTKFSHRPHINQPLLQDCTSCHAMDESLANSHTFVHFDPNDVSSNFAAIKKANCTSCHSDQGTDNGCTQCHNYHVGSKILLSQ